MLRRQKTSPKTLDFKVIVVGESCVGKTSIIRRYASNIFSPMYKGTIGADFLSRTLPYDSKLNIRLQLWDIAGQERFKSLTRAYYREALAAIVVYDVTRSDSLQECIEWKKDIDAKVLTPVTGRPIPTLLVGNKCDLCEVEIPDEEFCRRNGFCGVFKVSAKDNVNIEECMKTIAQKSKENYDEIVEHLATEQTDGGDTSFSVCSPSTIKIVSYPYNQVNAQSTRRGCCVK